MPDCELKDQFYDDLDGVLGNIPRKSIKIVVGDFNAQVGREKFSNQLWAKKVSMRLLSLCTDKGLVISSTQFQQKDIYKHTWIINTKAR